MKYENEQGEVWMLVTDWHSFKGARNYVTNFVLCQEFLEIGQKTEHPDSRNEADEEVETDDDYPWELDLFVIEQATLNVTETTFTEGEWYLNEIEELSYLFACVSNFIFPNMCIGTISSDNNEIKGNNSIWSVSGELWPSQAPFKTSFLSKNQVYNAFYKVPTHMEGQKPILFGKFETKVKILEPPESEEESLKNSTNQTLK